ncbi:M14-type cytosolic carboxypeptidase [Corallincola platygyrae]|uniref:M14-type cytosolic carboxypeptidase n=1 Tax=Corallincola platygyrae TaxID=1193278 RepID=A0ABW4XP54_9GAMM
MKISSQFDGGSIEVVSCESPDNIQVKIPKDNQSEFYQWFYFRLSGVEEQACTIKFLDLEKSAYPAGWKDYRAVASYDREHWFRVPTEFDGDTLTITHTPGLNSVYYAYFAPYSTERVSDFIASLQHSPLVDTQVLGETLDGQDMDLLTIGEPGEGKKVCWVIGRQHPGETMASWWMEGFLERLLDDSDPISREALAKAVFYVVPNMNPDGSRRGHLRTNACGANLNREWQTPSMERSPEVFVVREKMQQTGVDFCLDVHGDEALPYNFIAGAEGNPSWSERQADLQKQFTDALKIASPDFQTEYGYPLDAPGEANMTVCTNYMADAFDCLAMTLEMPFKDTVDSPDEEEGWSPDRCRRLGEANLNAILSVIPNL